MINNLHYMHHPKHTYLTGIITGSVMGIVMSFFSYSLLVYVAGGLPLNGNKISFFLEIMIATNIFIGAIFGIIVALLVHGMSKKN